ncbi:MAG: hypothetical protein M3345_01460 [Actinomycetota bacterium]|nr:hypothetical protein [Actinomycetota bacterium]
MNLSMWVGQDAVVRGHVQPEDGETVTFTGWLELLRILGELLRVPPA